MWGHSVLNKVVHSLRVRVVARVAFGPKRMFDAHQGRVLGVAKRHVSISCVAVANQRTR